MNPKSQPTSEELRQNLRHVLKRCSAATIEAALRFQETRDPAEVEPIILGLLAREIPEEKASDIATAFGETRLIEDLGLDSLGFMEAVMAAEEVFGVVIDNQDLRRITTLDQLYGFVKEKVSSST